MRPFTVVCGVLCLWATACMAQPPHTQGAVDCDASGRVCIRVNARATDICTAIDQEARRNGLPPGFFARLIWQESGFDPYAISHAGALGIAQFMPATARLRGLEDPFNPAAALVAAARYLAYLRDQFGSLGMAAVAYNAGENRAARFMKHTAGLPDETHAYVLAITGYPADAWRGASPRTDWTLSARDSFASACANMGHRQPGSPSAAPPRPWAAVIAAHHTRAVARARFAAAAERSPTLRAHKARLRETNGQFIAQVDFHSRSDALALCTKVKHRGVSCRVTQNR